MRDATERAVATKATAVVERRDGRSIAVLAPHADVAALHDVCHVLGTRHGWTPRRSRTDGRGVRRVGRVDGIPLEVRLDSHSGVGVESVLGFSRVRPRARRRASALIEAIAAEMRAYWTEGRGEVNAPCIDAPFRWDGWVRCPACHKLFSPADERAWRYGTHLYCGRRLQLQPSTSQIQV